MLKEHACAAATPPYNCPSHRNYWVTELPLNDILGHRNTFDKTPFLFPLIQEIMRLLKVTHKVFLSKNISIKLMDFVFNKHSESLHRQTI